MNETSASKCLHCGGDMPPMRVRRPTKVYCGARCQWAAYHRRHHQPKAPYRRFFHDYQCVSCGKPFRSPDLNRRKCSVFCGTRREDAQHPASLMTAAYLRTRLHYDPETGVFTWLARAPGKTRDGMWTMKYVGKRAGSLRNGARIITLDGVSYRAARLAWLYVVGEWPKDLIDHLDRDLANDRFANLREASLTQSMVCRGSPRSGLTGAYTYQKDKGRWLSMIKKDGKLSRLGWFDTEDEAHQAYLIQARKLYGNYVSSN